MQGLLVPEEQQALCMVWGPSDDWARYLRVHMQAIRAKFFPESAPKQVQPPHMHAASCMPACEQCGG